MLKCPYILLVCPCIESTVFIYKMYCLIISCTHYVNLYVSCPRDHVSCHCEHVWCPCVNVCIFLWFHVNLLYNMCLFVMSTSPCVIPVSPCIMPGFHLLSLWVHVSSPVVQMPCPCVNVGLMCPCTMHCQVFMHRDHVSMSSKCAEECYLQTPGAARWGVKLLYLFPTVGSLHICSLDPLLWKP